MGVKVGTAITRGTTGVSNGAISLPALPRTPAGSIPATTNVCPALLLASSRVASVFLICSCKAAGRLFALTWKPLYVTCPALDDTYNTPAISV